MRSAIITNPPLFVFKRWSRKNYGAYNSLKKAIKIGHLLIIYTFVFHSAPIAAQQDTLQDERQIDLEEVEVIGQRSPDVYSNVARIVTVITRDEIAQAPVQDIGELLGSLGNIDIRERGPLGVQSDISIRGGTFDHVLVLLNGINITDVQTGHLNLDLPVDLENIERIEILNGPGARVYGSNAFTGAINIITRKGKKSNLGVSAVYGEHGFGRWDVTTGTPLGKTTHQLSYSGSTSDGYSFNTGFSRQSVYYSGTYGSRNAGFEWQAGFARKGFGANAFYSPRFPAQYEDGDVILASLRFFTGEKIRFTPQVYWRRKSDHFILDKSNPDFYQNFHLTDIFGTQVNWSFESLFGKSSFGVDTRSENIISNNLGNPVTEPIPVKGEDSAFYTRKYSRTNIGLFWEQRISISRFSISGGAMFNWNSDYPQKPGFFPGIDLSYSLNSKLRLFSSFNRSVHLPTFTDLFYVDPSNQGNLDLKPGVLSSAEVGVLYQQKTAGAKVAYFNSRGRDIVDYLWSDYFRRFLAFNIPHYRSQGLEISAGIRFRGIPVGRVLENLQVNYAFLDVDKSVGDSLSKYYNLRNKLTVMLTHRLPGKMHATWNLYYQDRNGEYVTYDQVSGEYATSAFLPYWLADGRIFWQNKNLSIYVEASNILNTRYVDNGSLEQPGRWIRAGFRYEIEKTAP